MVTVYPGVPVLFAAIQFDGSQHFIAGLCCWCLLSIPNLSPPLTHPQPPQGDAQQSPAWAFPCISPVNIGKMENNIAASLFNGDL